MAVISIVIANDAETDDHDDCRYCGSGCDPASLPYDHEQGLDCSCDYRSASGRVTACVAW